MQTASDDTLLVHLNTLLHNGRFSLYDFQPYLEQTNFFTPGDDLKAALDVMLYNGSMLVQLCTQFNVMLKYRRPLLEGKLFWEFSCTSLPGERHRQDIKFNMDHSTGITDSIHAGMHRQPNMANPNTRTEVKSLVLDLNESTLMPSGVINLTLLKEHLVNCGFSGNEMHARCMVTEMVDSMPLLTQLVKEYAVTLKFWEGLKPKEGGWEFTCAKRRPEFGYETDSGFRQLNMGMGYQPYDNAFNPMGGFRPGVNVFPGNGGGPNEPVGNGVLVELLGAYVLTQIHPLPSSSRSRGLPHGLELLEMVKQRLRFQPPMVNPAPMMAGATMWMNNQPAGCMASSNPMFGMGGNADRFVLIDPAIVTPHYDITPPMLHGEQHRGVAYDFFNRRVVHYTTDRIRGGYTVYECTPRGNLLHRMEFNDGDQWVGYPGLKEVFNIGSIPSRSFTVEVSDRIEDTIATINEKLKEFPMAEGMLNSIQTQVKNVLNHKPIDSSEFQVLIFRMGNPDIMSEGLDDAIGTLTGGVGGPYRGCWIIHTGVHPQDPTQMPDRFWVLDDSTPRSNMF